MNKVGYKVKAVVGGFKKYDIRLNKKYDTKYKVDIVFSYYYHI